MRMSRVVVASAVAAGLMFGVAAVAAEPETPAGATPPAAEPAKPAKPAKGDKPSMDDPNRMVCTRERVVGSNRPEKICMTVAERQRMKEDADRFRNQGYGVSEDTSNRLGR